jgi:hypothetical protein
VDRILVRLLSTAPGRMKREAATPFEREPEGYPRLNRRRERNHGYRTRKIDWDVYPDADYPAL